MNNFAQRRKAKLRPEYPLAPNCRRSWWNMTGSTPASEHFNAKNATQMCWRAHKAWISNAISFQFCRIFTTPHTCTFDSTCWFPEKRNSGIWKSFPVYRGHLNFTTCCNCFQVFEFSLVHPVRLVFSEITHEICNGGVYLFKQNMRNVIMSDQPQDFTNENTSLEYCFHVLENKRSCGPKWETMRKQWGAIRANELEVA